MNLSLYLDQKTWVYQLDGWTKVLSLLALFTMTLVFSDPRYLSAVTVLLVGAVVAAQAFLNLRKLWLLLVLLFLYSMALWPFFITGQTPFFVLRDYGLTVEGVGYGVGMGLRIILMLINGVLLLSTTMIEEFTRALQRLGLPTAMGFALSLAFRWVPNLIGATGTIVQAQRSRGLDLSSGTVLAKIRRYPPLVVPLIRYTLRQTKLLAMALESKRFGPGQQRHHRRQSQMHLLDYLTLCLMLTLVGFSVWLRLNGYGTVDVRF